MYWTGFGDIFFFRPEAAFITGLARLDSQKIEIFAFSIEGESRGIVTREDLDLAF
jgi:hypothetical protein